MISIKINSQTIMQIDWYILVVIINVTFLKRTFTQTQITIYMYYL